MFPEKKITVQMNEETNIQTLQLYDHHSGQAWIGCTNLKTKKEKNNFSYEEGVGGAFFTVKIFVPVCLPQICISVIVSLLL